MDEEMVRYYALQAEEYDQNYAHLQTQNDLRTITNLVTELFAERRVYEVACGTGRWTQKLAQVATAVYAVDINESMLAVARKQEYPPNIVTLAHGDAYAPNASGEKFTGGLIGFWFSHVDLKRMDEFLIAFHSWLEPGAAVLIFDDLQTPDRLNIGHIDQYGNRYEPRQLPNGEKFEIIENFFTETFLRKQIDAYGTSLRYITLETKWALMYHVQ